MFILDRPSSDAPTFIFLFIRLSDGRLKYPVKAKAHPRNWSGQRCKDTAVNAVLNRIETKVAEMIQDATVRNYLLTRSAVRDALDVLLHRRAAPAHLFYDVIREEIDRRETGEVVKENGSRFAAYTIRNYRNTYATLQAFNPRLSFSDITPQFYDRFVAYLSGRGLSVNMIGQQIKNVRVFMKAAERAGHRVPDAFRGFRIPTEQTAAAYLTSDEIAQLYACDGLTPTLALVRDWFVLDCYTGLRISDIKLLTAENITDGVLRIVNEKTDTVVAIPIHRIVGEILRKYGGLPRRISDQKMNKYIKEAARLAGITAPVVYSITKGGKRVDRYAEKWEVVSNHTARRSFITNALKAGLSHVEVMKLAGLKKLATLQRYVKETEDETAQRLRGHSFFT